MKLAVLGTDPDTLALVAAATDAGHRIAWLGEIRPDDATDLPRVCSRVWPCRPIGNHSWTARSPTPSSSAAAPPPMNFEPSNSSGLRPKPCRCWSCSRAELPCCLTTKSTWLAAKATASCGTTRRMPARPRSPNWLAGCKPAPATIGQVHQVICQRRRPIAAANRSFATWPATWSCCATSPAMSAP